MFHDGFICSIVDRLYRKEMRDCFEDMIYLNRITIRLVINSEKISGELSVVVIFKKSKDLS